MKTNNYILILIFLIAVNSYSQEKTFTENDSLILVSVGENFNITLPSNHSTGFSWSLGMIAENSQVVVTGMDYDLPAEAKAGQGGEEVWHLKAVAQGKVILLFYYARSWEKDAPADTKSFIVQIN